MTHTKQENELIQRMQRAIAELKRAEADFHRSREQRLQEIEREVVGEIAPPASRLRVPNELRVDYEAFLYCFVALGGLRRNHAVLDVGCGRGRMAEQLVGFLSPEGRYEGFDVRGNVIEKLQRRISASHPRFNFRHANVFNKSYNPGGVIPAGEYIFPFENATFDFVFLLSIFTHLVPAAMEHYLAEIARVLKPGRRCVITYFLLNDESVRLIESGAIKKTFRHRGEHFRYEYEDVPERAIAVDEGFVRDMYTRHGLTIVDPIYYGEWCGRRGAQMRQDIVVAVRE